MIPFTHERNYPLYRLASDRGLKCEALSEGHRVVSSHSVKGRMYRVQLFPDGYLCSCEAAWSGKPCTHGSLAAATSFPDLLTSWMLAECQRMREAIRLQRHESECKAWRESFRWRVEAAEVVTGEMVRRFRRRQEEWEEWRGVAAGVWPERMKAA